MCHELKELTILYSWLKEVDSCALRCAIFDLEDAYKNYFQKRSNYPAFKSKYKRQTYRTNCMKSEYKGKKLSNRYITFQVVRYVLIMDILQKKQII